MTWGFCALVVTSVSVVSIAQADKGPEAIAAHKARAATAAGQEFGNLKTVACAERQTPPAPPVAAAGRGTPAAARPTPPRDEWYAEPMKVFDNFYFVGTKEHGAWAVTTSAGIIVIDALYDYAVIDEVEAGIKKLGLDPVNIKYLIVTHGHGDHAGGTKYLQDKYRPKVVMGAKDWDLVARDTRSPRPTRDVEAVDGQKITLGDTSVTLYITPGHTPSTISTIVPVRDNGVTHVAAEWGGTALNADTPVESIQSYVNSAVRFRAIAATARADAIFANHTVFDGTLAKLTALGARRPGQSHPFIVGPAVVDRYMTVVEECGRALLSSR